MNFNEKFKNVELHSHLDGSFKAKSIIEISKRRSIPLEYKTEEELINYLVCKERKCLRDFLKPFLIIVPIFAGDKEAIWQMSYDFIEQCAKAKTCYVEARFCPKILSGIQLDCNEVIKTVLDAFQICNKKFGVEARVIISGLRELVDETSELIELAKVWQPHGVVGIDIAGDEQLSIESGGTHTKLVNVFKRAQKEGIHRTVHAGENGHAASVREAVYDMHAERLGHGYQVLEDDELYIDLKKKNIHFEVCPTSSFLTGAVPINPALHPINRFAQDKVNYSINCDDTMVTGRLLDDEIQFSMATFNLSLQEINRVRLNSAKSSFLNQNEKDQLLQHLKGLGIF